jgi:hypothetical protein
LPTSSLAVTSIIYLNNRYNEKKRKKKENEKNNKEKHKITFDTTLPLLFYLYQGFQRIHD